MESQMQRAESKAIIMERKANRKQSNIFNKEIPQIITGDRRVQNSGKLTDRTANGEGHDATKTGWES